MHETTHTAAYTGDPHKEYHHKKIRHIETQTEWECRMFGKVMECLREELCIDLPYMERALAALEPEGKENVRAFATEGIHLYYPPAHYLKLFEENELFLRRAYLHTVLHCLYAHLWQRADRAEGLWNLACDIAVEAVIDSLDQPSTKRLLSWTRQQIYGRLREQKLYSAAGIYGLLENEPPEKLAILAQEFYTDDHALWGSRQKQSPMPGQGEPPDPVQQKWQQIARRVQLQKQKSDRTQDAAAAALQQEILAQRKRRSYRDFLLKFAAFHEQLRVDIDTFDLNYYTYGLRTYGNLPLIEPVETREEHRIREFVIAIDTSYSTKGELVRAFLQETLHILLEKQMYSDAAHIHLIQCDDAVQEDVVITDMRQAQELLAHYEIKGGGSTDFRPVFRYIEQLRGKGVLRELGGLIYFTDGNGTYPAEKPDYPCAFVYLDDYREADVPVWAIRQRLSEEERNL